MVTEKTPLPVYDSAKRGFFPWLELREAIRYRDAIFHLTRRDIVARYKRSFLGIIWTMLNPLGMMLILTVVFSTAFNTGPTYAAYVLTGLLAWNFFSQTSNAVVSGLAWGSGLVQKVYLPRSIFGISAIGTGLVNFILALAPLLLVMLATGVPIRLSVLFAPIAMLMLACFSLGIGLFLATVGLYFPDVTEMYQILLIAWMYLTPIIYPETILPENIRLLFFWLNPMYRLVRLFRYPVYEGEMLPISEISITMLMAISVFVLGWWLFSRKANEFAYRA